MTRYQPADAFVTPRFSGIRTFARLPYQTELSPDIDAAIVGIPFDTAVSYRVGARFGPGAVREMSVMTRTYNPSLDVRVYDHLSVVDYGDLPTVPGYIEDTYDRIVVGLRPLLEAGITPIVIGGDHSISLGELRALAAVYGPIGFLQFDSHPDTWDRYFGREYFHGTPFRRAVEEGLIDTDRAIQVGLRGSIYGPEDFEQSRELGFEIWTSDDVRREGIAATLKAIRNRLGSGPIFLTFDIDFLDPAYAPGTGTPEVGGFSSREAQEFMRGLVGLDIRAMDLVEVLPAYDPSSITALAAANVIFEGLSVLAINKRDGC